MKIRWCSRLHQTHTFHEYVRLVPARASFYLSDASARFFMILHVLEVLHKCFRFVRRTQDVDRRSTFRPTLRAPRNHHWLRHSRPETLFQKLKVIRISVTISSPVCAASYFESLDQLSLDGNPVRYFRRVAKCLTTVTRVTHANRKTRSDLFYNGMRCIPV